MAASKGSPSGRDGLPEEQTVVIKGLLSVRMGASSAAHATGSASQSGIFLPGQMSKL